MDVHRARFVPHPTSAITCLAFSRSNDSGHFKPPPLKLALGRASGSVEIWNPNNGNWFQEAVFLGDGRSIDGLAWTQDPDETHGEGDTILGQQRLFSIASSPAVTEWDLGKGSVKRRSTGNFSEVWCFAVQPQVSASKTSNANGQSSQAQEIVAGCGDGSIAVLSTADDDLQFKRFLARVSGRKARCMCITYQSRDVIVAGFADSMIRVYDTRTGHQLRTLSLGVGLPGAPKTSLVWQVKCLPNGDIASADSNGEVRIWDSKTYSLLQRVKGHSADCLDLVTSSDGKTIFSGSIDGKIAVYKQSTTDKGSRRWAKTSGRGIHHGEVKAMAAFDSKVFSVVVLGGSGVAPMVFPLRDYGKAYPRSLSNLPHNRPVTSAPDARLLVSWWNEEISIWRIRGSPETDTSNVGGHPKQLVATMALSGQKPIRSVSISPDGMMLVASTDDEIKLFQLDKQETSHRIKIRRVPLPVEFGKLGGRLVQISPDGKWIAAISAASEIHVARVKSGGKAPGEIKIISETVELERNRRTTKHQSRLRVYDQSITHVAFSSDSRVLAVGDRLGRIDSWRLEGDENLSLPATQKVQPKNSASSDDESDESSSDDDDDDPVAFYGQHWIDNPATHHVPKLEAAPLVFTFRPSEPQKGLASRQAAQSVSQAHNLFIVTARHAIHEIDLDRGGLTDWSRSNPASALPIEVKNIKDRAMGAVWDMSLNRQRVWIYGTSWVLMLNLSARALAEAIAAHGTDKTRKRRNEASDETDGDGKSRSTKKTRTTSAAGGRVMASDADGFRGQARIVTDGQSRQIGLDEEISDDDGDDVENEDDGRARRGGEGGEDVDMIDDEPLGSTVTDAALLPSSASSARDDAVMTTGETTGRETPSKSRDRFSWLTFDYRPILGMVPLSSSSKIAGTDEEDVLEVVIVERPVWETTTA